MPQQNQTITGKAFEYACAKVIYEKYRDCGNASLIESPQMETARRAFYSLDGYGQDDYILGAEAAERIISRLEPMLSDGDSPMAVCLQTDAQGIGGDVRDVLCLRGREWEIGLSCKHNHEAVKHSRLSDIIDFGQEWFGIPCSGQYFDDVNAIFGPLRRLRDQSREEGAPALWRDIPDKNGTIYVPVLNAFMSELERLDDLHPREIPALLIQYMIGRNDFYKVIMNERRRFTKIESVNIHGTLNRPNGRVRSLVDVPLMRLPTRFYEIDFKEDSSTTIEVVCNNGWSLSMRIHNASSRIEPSLKFDVQLEAMPNAVLTQIEPWEDNE